MFSRFKVFGEPRSSTFQQQSWKTQKQQDIHTKKGSKNDDPHGMFFRFPFFWGSATSIYIKKITSRRLKPPFSLAPLPQKKDIA